MCPVIGDPIRAGMARTPETSDYTSIQERIRLLKNPDSAKTHKSANQKILEEKGFIEQPLAPFLGSIQLEQADGIPYSLEDYLELVDWTGRAIRKDKRGAIPSHIPSILTRLNLDADEWLENCQKFESRYCRVVGRIKRVQRYIKRAAQKWCRGQDTLEKMFSSG